MYEKELRLIEALRKLYKNLDDSLAKHLKELGVSSSDFLMLSVLEKTGPITMQILGEHLSITSGTITYVTDRAISKGLVMKIQDSEDKRKFFLKLTDFGHETLSRVSSEHLPYIRKVFSAFSDDELDEITGTIIRLGVSVKKNK